MSGLDGEERVRELLGGLLDNYDPHYGLGSMTCSVYDTAWVACISKTIANCSQWLFPLSFSFILSSQSSDGGWPAHPEENETGEATNILSTMAALFCLSQHARNPLQLKNLISSNELSIRIQKAVSRLSILLESWRTNDCATVAFELLAPSLLELLHEEGFEFDFRDKQSLLKMRDQKFSKLRPETLYGTESSTLLHSLEAFHGRKDFSFDRISHHMIHGSMMASPSATASFLIRCTGWNDEAEAYLRLVLSNGDGQSSGAVPSAYPSTNFELIWVSVVSLPQQL